MLCRRCRYELKGLDLPRCPECGHRFDRNDPDSFIDAERHRRRRVDMVAAAILLALAPVLVYVVFGLVLLVHGWLTRP